jgi:hypothetical protein
MKQPVRRFRMPGRDRNPLRRRIDRLEAAVNAGLILAFLIAAPVLPTLAVHWTRAAGIRQQLAVITWRQVPANVVRGAPRQRDVSPGPDGTAWRPARWTAPDGRPRSGWIPVSPQAPADSSARVWVNRSGSLTGQPLQRAQLQRRIVIAGVLTAVMLGLVLCLVGGAGRYLFSRRRLADWDKAWRVVGPRWTRQL